MLKFSSSNSKMLKLARFLKVTGIIRLIKSVLAFDLPAGFTCPKADICKTFFIRPKYDENGQVKERGYLSRVGRVLCYAAKMEAVSPSAMRLRWHNFDMLKKLSFSDMVNLILESIPNGTKVIRIHSSGDFFSPEYFKAWRMVAQMRPDISFFGYTKILEYALEAQYAGYDNFHLNYSFGSEDDTLGELVNTSEGVRFMFNGSEVATCFIEEYDNQYPNTMKVCNGKGAEHEDYFAILNKQTFIIGMH